MFLTLAGRLCHNTGAAVWNDLSPRDFFVFLMGNCNRSFSEERSWYLHFSFNRTRLQIYRMALVDILLLTLKVRF